MTRPRGAADGGLLLGGRIAPDLGAHGELAVRTSLHSVLVLEAGLISVNSDFFVSF